jgi:hypothetical protein
MSPSLEKKIERLPDNLLKELEGFTDYLLLYKVQPQGKKLKLSWAGGLAEIRD